jgi:hypothetical protein
MVGYFMYNTNDEDNMSFDFYMSKSRNGVVKYFPDNEDADDLLKFLGVEEMYVDDPHMDKIYNWLVKMGHECYVENEPQRRISDLGFMPRRLALKA